jgi:hypothetical protein
MAAPPLLDGATNVTVAWLLPDVALTPVGSPGVVANITLLEALDAGPIPTLFAAVTVNVYAVPSARPITAIGLVAPLAVTPPGLDVTV